MFFRRNEGEYRETDRVTRFKLIKSGKQWLRAATSNFGLFKVVKGGADAPSVSAQSVEEKHRFSQGKLFLKGLQQREQWLEAQWQLIQPKRKKRQLQLWKAK